MPYLTWFGQAGFLLESGGESIVIDPYFSDTAAEEGFIRLYAPPVSKGGLRVNYAVSTHNHSDHLDIETLRDYISFDEFYGPSSCAAAMNAAGFSGKKIHTLDRGCAARAGAFELYGVFAEHTEDSIGVIVKAEGLSVYFSGDTLFNPRIFEAKTLKPDILAVCINGKFGNMSWQEAVVFAHRLGVKQVIPMHYDLFAINAEDPAQFAAAFQNSPITCRILKRGAAYNLPL